MKSILPSLRRTKMHHLLSGAVVFFGWYYFLYQDYPPVLGWWINLFKVGDLSVIIYTTKYLLIPRLLYKKKYVLFTVVFIVFVFSFSLLKMYVEEGIMR